MTSPAGAFAPTGLAFIGTIGSALSRPGEQAYFFVSAA